MEKEKLSAQHLGVTLRNDFITKLFLPSPSKVEESQLSVPLFFSLVREFL
jgi:hypothetical protein